MAKFKSLKETRWTRFRTFLRGLLLYNTVYWRRASDGVDRNASRVGRMERQNKRPRVDPELLRPRTLSAIELRKEEADNARRTRNAEAEAPDVSASRRAMPAMGDELFGGHLPDAADHAVSGETRSRRKRRTVRRRELRDNAVDPGRVLRNRNDAQSRRLMPGWLRWLIGWHH